MTVEEKIIAGIRKILIADATLSSIIGTNVYASHISSITKPVYPAISLYVISGSGADYNALGMATVNLQIDTWLPTQQYDMSTIMQVQDRLRNILHRQSITDATIPVSGSGWERNIGPVIVEEDVELLHLPVVYTFMAF